MDEFKGQARLPKFAVPKRYDLRLKPDLSACTFTGTVSIDLHIVSDTKFVVFNAADLSFLSLRFTSSSKVFEPVKFELVEEDEIVVLEFTNILPIGVGILVIQFDGVLNDQMKGFYRSTYDLHGEKRNMAATQFEAVDARRCFPCWDEPACKAIFKITLDVPSDLMALSNMPVVEQKVDGKLKTVFFQETPVMSTYLVAVVVGLFDYVEDYTSDGIKVRVYCQVGKSDQGKFALDVGVKALELYKEYFTVQYPLPKLDMITIPDFIGGGMENYGLVTYSERALLFDDKNSAADNKKMVTIVVAHELAHQWFGNLVTMEWWTHVWLNEGFATWVSYLAADSFFPEWNIWTQFLVETADALRLDGLEESHPIEVEVNHASEVDAIFDDISYKKGASVIRMLQSYLGAEPFQRSLVSYIKKYAYSNAKTADLWAAIEEGSGEPVNKLMNSWTRQKGYPVVSVKLKDQKLEFEQSQFLLSGSHEDEQWIIPINFCCGSYDVGKNFLLQTKSKTLDAGEFGPVEIKSAWIKVNVNQTGFYRVKYDEDLAARLRFAIEKKYLSETDRFGILDDAFALSMACQQSLTSVLILMDTYREEHEYTVLSNLLTICNKIARIAADATPELLEYFNQFFINLYQDSAERLGWDAKRGDSDMDAMLRGEILMALAIFGHKPTLNEAKRRFQAFLNDRNTPLLPPDIRKAAYVAVMQRVSASNRSGYESLLRIYRETDLSQEKMRILNSLASCPDPIIVLEALNFLLSSEVRSEDAVWGLHASKEGREAAWTWLKDNWEYISKTWGSGLSIHNFITAVVSPFASFEKAKEVEEFFANRTTPSTARSLKQSIEQVKVNAMWVQSIQNEKQLADVVKELAQRKTSDAFSFKGVLRSVLSLVGIEIGTCFPEKHHFKYCLKKFCCFGIFMTRDSKIHRENTF